MQNAEFQKTIYPSRLTSMTSPSHSASMDTSSRTKLYDHGCSVKLDLTDGSSLYAKLVVGADGAKSRVRELAGLKTTGWNYSQNAVICSVKHNVENECAWQRFLPAGPIALLPMGDKFSNIVWTMNPKESSEYKSMNEDDFVKAVNHALDYGYGPHPHSSFGGTGDRFSWLTAGVTLSANECFEVPPKVVKVVSERMVFPLSLMHANDYVSNRVVLIGDAAHTVHPLAGQGVNLGFGDAFALSKVIAEGIAVGTDIGEVCDLNFLLCLNKEFIFKYLSFRDEREGELRRTRVASGVGVAYQVSLLKKFEAERKTANIMMMAILDGFQKAYSVDFGPLNILRAAALHGAQYIMPLKRNIISYATGEVAFELKANGDSFDEYVQHIDACDVISTRYNGEIVHALTLKLGFDWETLAMNFWVDAYAKDGLIDNARLSSGHLLQTDLVHSHPSIAALATSIPAGEPVTIDYTFQSISRLLYFLLLFTAAIGSSLTLAATPPIFHFRSPSPASFITSFGQQLSIVSFDLSRSKRISPPIIPSAQI
ncbi:hypothetical protein HHK36_022393 [Tetracentron sinense]|uniref:FAD-binding domain-containing protein n=1 Tax=Tetracentron sinense TaxID=13715 RepID=A0A835D693_TETSI|nr:hypothetical protein HHK36_022393 [Tetracentron sinense]